MADDDAPLGAADSMTHGLRVPAHAGSEERPRRATQSVRARRTVRTGLRNPAACLAETFQSFGGFADGRIDGRIDGNDRRLSAPTGRLRSSSQRPAGNT